MKKKMKKIIKWAVGIILFLIVAKIAMYMIGAFVWPLFMVLAVLIVIGIVLEIWFRPKK